MHIRPETAADREQIYDVNVAAFSGMDEANLVDKLRSAALPLISLVAEHEHKLLGHILFSPVTLDSHPDLQLMGLAPMAVIPERQYSGIGSDLVGQGLDACRAGGVGAVVVLGHPEYYPRFGFRPARELGLVCEFDVPPEAFMALELTPGYLQECQGTVAYHPLFGSL